jgi:hypothetical protein
LGGLGLTLGFALGVKGFGGVLSIRASTASRELSGGFVMGLKSKREYIRRRLKPAPHTGFKEYCQLIGEVTWASNTLHGDFQAAFWQLMPGRKGLARDLWHTIKSDDGQRSLLKAAILQSDDHNTRRGKALLWALNQAGTLSGYRNDAIHTAFQAVHRGKGMTPGVWADPKRVERLNKHGYKRLFTLLRGDLAALSVYVGAIWMDMMFDERVPLPRRPRLQLPPLIQKSLPPSNNPRRGSRRQRRRQKASSGRLSKELRDALLLSAAIV